MAFSPVASKNTTRHTPNVCATRTWQLYAGPVIVRHVEVEHHAPVVHRNPAMACRIVEPKLPQPAARRIRQNALRHRGWDDYRVSAAALELRHYRPLRLDGGLSHQHFHGLAANLGMVSRVKKHVGRGMHCLSSGHP